MTSVRIDRDVASGRIALLIFSPDAIAGHWIEPVERWIRERTACAPIARGWFSYTDEALARFYPDVVHEPSWPLVARYFNAGPCLATLWYGENAAQRVRASKGTTHPAQSGEDTVRGRFCCDNALTNLVHVSDSQAEIAGELDVLRSVRLDLFAGALPIETLPVFRDGRPSVPRHSGILTLCSLVMTFLSTHGSACPELEIPDRESARQTMSRAEAWLSEARKTTPAAFTAAIDGYLEGSAVASQRILTLKNAVPVSAWEELVLTAGMLSRPLWLEGRID